MQTTTHNISEELRTFKADASHTGEKLDRMMAIDNLICGYQKSQAQECLFISQYNLLMAIFGVYENGNEEPDLSVAALVAKSCYVYSILNEYGLKFISFDLEKTNNFFCDRPALYKIAHSHSVGMNRV
jgi:hypothetical protein